MCRKIPYITNLIILCSYSRQIQNCAIQTPYRLSYFLCLSSFLLSETASSCLFLFIIFSFQNFRYHSGITNGFQCSYCIMTLMRDIGKVFLLSAATLFILLSRSARARIIRIHLHLQPFHLIHSDTEMSQ